MKKGTYNIKDILYSNINNESTVNYVIHVLKTKDNVIANDENDYPLRWAAHHNYTNLVAELLKYPEVNPLCDNYFCFDRSIYNNNINILGLLIHDQRTLKDITLVSLSIIRKCIECNNSKVFEYILSFNIIDIKDFFNIIFLDYNFRNNKCLNILLNDKRFDSSYMDNKFLQICIKNKDYDIIKLLIKNNKVISKLDTGYINLLGNLKILPNYNSKKIERII